jgi:hypothetical protein
MVANQLRAKLGRLLCPFGGAADDHTLHVLPTLSRRRPDHQRSKDKFALIAIKKGDRKCRFDCIIVKQG